MQATPETVPFRLFFDSSVLIAGAFSQKGASYILLQLANLTLLDGRVSADECVESERNVLAKLPAALPILRVLINDALTIGPPLQQEQIQQALPYADPKDAPILASAIGQQCQYLVTLNEKDFWPLSTVIKVVRPGIMLQEIRRLYTESKQ